MTGPQGDGGGGAGTDTLLLRLRHRLWGDSQPHERTPRPAMKRGGTGGMQAPKENAGRPFQTTLIDGGLEGA